MSLLLTCMHMLVEDHLGLVSIERMEVHTDLCNKLASAESEQAEIGYVIHTSHILLDCDYHS